MISFKAPIVEFSDKRYADAVAHIEENYSTEELLFIVEHGYLLARAYSPLSGYMLSYPVAVEPELPVRQILHELTEYCIREDISEVYFAVPRDSLGVLLADVREAQIHLAAPEEYIVILKNELSYIESDCTYEQQGLSFALLSHGDTADYMRLVTDIEHNKYYGYEITDDISGESFKIPEYAEQMLLAARALSLVVREGEKFIGEAVIYNPDNRGGAEISFRVLRALCGRGYGRRILKALFAIADEIGIATLRARVIRQNIPSCRLCESEGMQKQQGAADDIVEYRINVVGCSN